ncbi:MAG: hypothetical protein K2H85_11220, partial [Allobaculum sp.]|nr:hypothetical protein [Allobaculum sp.]
QNRTQRQAVGSQGETQSSQRPDVTDYTSLGNGSFPSADDTKDHNAYFGMKFQIPFTLEEGYAAPLNYFFYGDDDMYVFLSKCTRDDDTGEITSIDRSSTVMVADLGGVHSSIGMYVNLWNFINPQEKELIEVRSAGQTLNGIEERIYQYKAPASSYSRETGGDDTEITKLPSQDYVLSFFYTERGASGSSCYMRFSIPFQELGSISRAQDGEIQIGKKVQTAAIAAQNDEAEETKKYIFELTLTNANGTHFSNVYPIVIHDSDHKPVTYPNSIINSNELDPSTDDVIEGEPYYAITTGGRFTLTSGQHAYIYGLPRTGPYDGTYTFDVEEVGIYDSTRATVPDGNGVGSPLDL